MTEQLYKIEERVPLAGELEVWGPALSVCHGRIGVLVPVPATHTLAWALGEMLAHEHKPYWSGVEKIWRRYSYGSFDSSMDEGKTWQHGGNAQIYWECERHSTSWSPCEAEESKPVPQPGSYSEAYAAVLAGKVAIGSNGWRYWGYRESDKACSAARLDGGDVRVINWPHPRSGDWMPGGWTIEAPKPAIVPGSREWLTSLPDGTEVEHDRYGERVKRGDKVYETRDWVETGRYMSVSYLLDSGWRLRTQPQVAPTLEQRVERLEKLMEVRQ